MQNQRIFLLAAVACICLVDFTWSNPAELHRNARQIVQDMVVIEDTVVPDPIPQVVDTVQTQDTLVGPTGAQIPISSSSSSQVSPIVAPGVRNFNQGLYPQRQGGFYKREFPKKFQFFTPTQSTTATADLQAARVVVPTTNFQAKPSFVAIISKPAADETFEKTVALKTSHPFTATTDATVAVTALVGTTFLPIPSVASSLPTDLPSVQTPHRLFLSFSNFSAADVKEERVTTRVTATTFPATTTEATTELPTTKIAATAVAISTFPLASKNFTFNETTTSKPAALQAITFTVRPKNKLRKEKKFPAQEVLAVPMSRENSDIYSIAERASALTTTITPSFSTIESNKTIISTNGSHPFLVSTISKTSVLTAALPTSDFEINRPLKTTVDKTAHRDEEPPVTEHQLDLAAERALLVPGKNLELTARNGTTKEPVFTEFNPRQLFN